MYNYSYKIKYINCSLYNAECRNLMIRVEILSLPLNLG